MELGLSLGEAPKPFSFMEKASKSSSRGLGFCMALGVGLNTSEENKEDKREGERRAATTEREGERDERVSAGPPIQLDLLPLAPVPRYPPPHLTFPWSADHGNSEAGSSCQMANTRGFDVNRLPSAEDNDDAAAAAVDSPNSAASSFQMDFSMYRGGKRDSEAAAANEAEAERASSRASDEEENGLARKKLRLSKEQSAFLEESFKEHNTLNPKQKLALAKQLNLRPRQVEVWFQNRRARTKLKQTEVDCEYLKRCCETLTEENRRLQKELQELRALKTSHPFYMQLPATTLTMCPSCERVATTTTAASTDASKASGFSTLTKPRFYPFSQPHQSAAS
ncbi:homeobox-leucine zipper protein HOX11-like [Magnolia sinica]|uniref:homeobox-leucine zipper protein HOX11-like n=1 Tax=Magnolia sinica TaxID=86752 RepID=UPI0026585400|nr:homeobox-leucine zipper protein HOX11-like [Magnolia sinica]